METKMVLLLVTGIFPPDIGGPATYVPQIAKALIERGHSVTVITLSDRLHQDDSLYPFPIIRLQRQIFKPWRWLQTVLKIIELGSQSNKLFVNGLAMEAVLANLLLRKPMVQKVVGDIAWERSSYKGWVEDSFEDFQQQRYGLKLEGLKWLRSWWTRQADDILVPSRYLRKWVEGWGVAKDKVSVIYNALEIASNIQPAAVALKTPLKVVTVARLVTWKHIDRLMAVVAQLANVGLVIVGDGPERWHLEEQRRELAMTDRVYFAGQKSKKETLALMAACDIFVLNSSHEGLPHVVLEAMSLGLPVVATAVGGTPEVVKDGENGRLVTPMDNEELMKVLEQLIVSSEERQLLGEGAKRTAEKFSFQEMITETEQLLAKCSSR